MRIKDGYNDGYNEIINKRNNDGYNNKMKEIMMGNFMGIISSGLLIYY